MTPPDRSLWQPLLLAELARTGKLSVAIDLSGATRKAVRYHRLRDAERLGANHPDTLGNLIKAAKAAHRAANRAARQRAADRKLAEEWYRRVEHNRMAAQRRWAGHRNR